MKKTLKILVVIILATGLSACVRNLIDNQGGFSQNLADNQAVELAHKKQLAKQGGVDNNSAKNQLITNIMNRLINGNKLWQKDVVPILLKDNGVNAYSLGSKSRKAYVYFTGGLLGFVENESQLAGVAAHELGHIFLEHHALRQGGSTAQFNRAQEYEADKYSMRLLKQAGFDPNEVIRLLQRLAALESKQVFNNPDDYPTASQRSARLLKVIAAN